MENATTSRNLGNIVEIVNEAYSDRARQGAPVDYANKVAEAFGYTEEQLRSVPENAHMGLSCGNPVAAATIKEGETVVDLGSGGGIDVLLAADKVGPTGKAIGLDMSQDMISLARKNAAKKGLKPPQVAFVQALLTEPLPIEPDSVDCILSNCVINLLPFDGKAHLLKEVHRILKPGGRIVLDDIIAKKELPGYIKDDLASYVGCISGALLLEQYKSLLNDADVLFVDNKSDLSVYYQQSDSNSGCSTTTTGCCTPAPRGSKAQRPSYDVNEWAASYQIYAKKEGGPVPNPPTALLRWWDAYPTVKSSPASMTAEEVASLIRGEGDAGEFAVIDVRRNDHAGGHVRGSHNHHAQTFFDELPAFYERFKDTKKVIFYCQSSNGRGPRCAGWYQDYLNSKANHDNKSTAYVLKGGIKNWLSKFEGQEDLVDAD
ncbi:Arsenite methyltransferase [Psilocybe cubensis]|uniref:Arsenite methyltransferase n=2 Tax=Psilocybe cubensis TaxID=181762 RepID=A0A8H8CE17_PSICU|nr:Arsenite methyltransferase [Psilocybe cubensis]KAH9481820.1 Arsenite methyltransferase [Psilocybe cubensis]